MKFKKPEHVTFFFPRLTDKIIIKVFTKRKSLSVETILSVYMHTKTHTGARTHEHILTI